MCAPTCGIEAADIVVSRVSTRLAQREDGRRWLSHVDWVFFFVPVLRAWFPSEVLQDAAKETIVCWWRENPWAFSTENGARVPPPTTLTPPLANDTSCNGLPGRLSPASAWLGDGSLLQILQIPTDASGPAMSALRTPSAVDLSEAVAREELPAVVIEPMIVDTVPIDLPPTLLATPMLPPPDNKVGQHQALEHDHLLATPVADELEDEKSDVSEKVVLSRSNHGETSKRHTLKDKTR